MGKWAKTIEIEASPEKVFAFGIDNKKMNDAMKDFAESEITSKGPFGVGTTIHFVGKAGGQQLEWDMEVTEFEKNKKIAYRSVGASKFKMTNSTTLEPTAKGTNVTYSVDYKLPYSILGKLVDKLRVSKDIDRDNTKLLENIKKALDRIVRAL